MLPLLVLFEGSKINVTKVARFDKNMAVGKSKNLVTLHPYDLTQPFFRGYSDFGYFIELRLVYMLSSFWLLAVGFISS